MRASRLAIAYFCLSFPQVNKFLEFFSAIWKLKLLPENLKKKIYFIFCFLSYFCTIFVDNATGEN